jgi:tryptophan-rich sensory protein
MFMHKSDAFLITGSAVAAAAGTGARFAPGPNRPRTALWYTRLRKPPFTPPGPAFGVVWTMLDAALWYSGYRLATRPATPMRNFALGFWGATLMGVGGFTWVLFGRRRLGQALGVTTGMVASTAGLVATASVVDKRAAQAAAPLALWVAFAFLLQEEVWRRNR